MDCIKKITKLSLKKTLILYIVVAVISVIIMYGITFVFCNSWRNMVYAKYNYLTSIEYTSAQELYFYKGDKLLLNAINYIEAFSVVIYAVMAIIITVNVFFKNKLKEPITLLTKEAEYIRSNDMSFVCIYHSGDEMGEICKAMDNMRLQLCENQKKMWDMMEKQRHLNNAFAHDIRTPLTVIQGYLDLIQTYYPQGKISEDKLMETIDSINTQTSRLKNFSNTMKEINDFESMEVKLKHQDFKTFSTKIEENMKGLGNYHHIDLVLNDKLPREKRKFDYNVISEVLDNLLSNAISYAKSRVEVTMEYENKLLLLYVADDGKGFTSEELYKACKPYYIGRENHEEHFGIGLTICSMLCEKHGGYLKLYNSTKGGAIACAIFSVL